MSQSRYKGKGDKIIEFLQVVLTSAVVSIVVNFILKINKRNCL